MKLDTAVRSISYLFKSRVCKIRSFLASSGIYPIYTGGGVMKQRSAFII